MTLSDRRDPQTAEISEQIVRDRFSTSGTKSRWSVDEYDTTGVIGVQDEQENSSPNQKRQHVTFSQFLRFVGTAILLFAAFSYLRQGWQNAESLWRYYSFLGFTVVMAATGLLCGLGLRETKGARTLLGVSLSFLPAHFAQLGALLYGALFGAIMSVPSYLRFETTTAKASATIAIASVVLIPLSYAAFAALARKRSGYLTVLFTISNALLLIPTRDPLSISLLSITLTVSMTLLDRYFLASDSSMKTKEGVMCRVMLYTPAFLVLLRNALLYDFHLITIACLHLTIATAMFTFPKTVTDRARIIKNFESWSFVPVLIAWMYVFYSIRGYMNGVLVPLASPINIDAAMVLMIWTPVVLAGFGMSLAASQAKSTLRNLAAYCALYGLISAEFSAYGALASAACAIAGAPLSFYGYRRSSLVLFIGGIFVSSCGVFYILQNLWNILNIAPWMALATLGLTAVLGSSLIEKRFYSVVARGKTLVNHFAIQ